MVARRTVLFAFLLLLIVYSAAAMIQAAATAADVDAAPSSKGDAEDPPKAKIADVIKDTIQGAIDGTLKDTLQEKVQQKVQEALTEPQESSDDDTALQTTVVLRISKQFIQEHAPPAVEESSRVDRCLFGAHVTGTATTRGRPALTMATDHNQPVFTLHFKGSTSTRTVATKPPVRAYNTGVGQFDVHREIRFNGTEFSEGPESIEASYSSRLEGLGTPPGLRGCLVRRFALPEIARTRPRADAIALNDMKASLLEAFGKHTDKLVDDLNANVPWKQSLALLVPQQSGWVSHFASTDDWIMTSPGPADAKVPELPEEAADAKAPLELWVHGKPSDMSATKLVTLWSTVHVGLNRFRDLAPASAKDAVADLKPVVEGDWWVLRVGSDLLERFIDGVEDDAED